MPCTDCQQQTNSCTECKHKMNALLSNVPIEWRSQLITVLCGIQIDTETVTCQDVTDCETETTLSAFSNTGSQICITYTNEKGVVAQRCIDISTVFNNKLDLVDPKCIASQDTWQTMDFTEKFQAIVDKQCECCSTTTSTTAVPTTTSTTLAPTTTTTTTHLITTTTTTSSTTSTTTLAPVTSTTTTTTIANFTAYWGWKTTNTPFSDVASIASAAQGNGSFPSGTNTTVDFTANTQPKYLFYAEPALQPLKTKWDGDGAGSLIQGNIGGIDDLFASPVNIEGYHFYITNYETQFNDHTIDFKTS